MDSHILLELEEKLLLKKSKLKQILDITLKQAQVMKEQKLEDFIELLVMRQLVMNEVDQIDNEINIPKRSAVEEDILNNNPILKIKKETQALLDQIIVSDKENNIKFNQEFTVLKQKLKGLNHNKTLHQAYQPAQKSQGFGFFIDKKK